MTKYKVVKINIRLYDKIIKDARYQQTFSQALEELITNLEQNQKDKVTK